MHSVVIAEDEMLCRMGIAASVPWNDLGLSIAASVSDGDRALEVCRELCPDILITDIRMPHLSGLELVRILRGENPRMRIIIVTCIEDFRALHEAMELGVTGYLPKATMTREDLLAVLRRALDELGAPVSAPQAQSSSSDDAGAVLLASFPASASPAQVRSASAAILEKLSSIGFWSASSSEGRAEFSLPLPASVPDFETLCRTLAETQVYLADVLECVPALLYHVFDRSAPLRLSALRDRAEAFFSEPYFSSEPVLLDSDGGFSSAASRRIFAHLLENPACTGYRTGALRREALSSLQDAQRAFGISRASFDSSLLAFSERVFGGLGFLPSEDRLRALRGGIPASPTAAESLELLERSYPEFSLHPVYRDALTDSIAYIGEHLSESLGLPALARQVSVSPNYYALLFKSAVGLSVSEFIARLRLERACALLLEDRLSIQEIASACGFSDVPYFSRFFKQYTGQPPRRWKKSHEES